MCWESMRQDNSRMQLDMKGKIGKNMEEGLTGEGRKRSIQKDRKITLKVSAGYKYLHIYRYM